jgi:hypothetical protein
MKVLKYIPFILLSACSTTKNLDNSIHYSNYQSYSVGRNDTPKPSSNTYSRPNRRESDEILYTQQNDEDYLQDSRNPRTASNNRENRTYHVQNYYENAPQPAVNCATASAMRAGDDVQYLPPNLFFRAGEYNPFRR